MMTDTDRRDALRLNTYNHILSSLGLSAKRLDSLGPAERKAAIAQAIKLKAMERTDEQILMREGIDLRLMVGPGVERVYALRPRRISESKAARRYIGLVIGQALKELKVDGEGGGSMNVAGLLERLLPWIFDEGIEHMVELMFLYQPDLERDRALIEQHTPEDLLIGEAIKAFKFLLPLIKGVATQLMEIGQDLMPGLMGGPGATMTTP